MQKTISQRVMELTMKNGKFNRAVARRAFRGYSAEALHNSVMRRARELAQAGMLSSDNGTYTLTARGRRMTASTVAPF